MWAERFALFQEKPLWAMSRALFREKLYGEISAIRVVKRKDSSVKRIVFLFYTLFLLKGDMSWTWKGLLAYIREDIILYEL